MAIAQVLIATVLMTLTGGDGTGWVLRPATASEGPLLTFTISNTVHYTFECTPKAVIVTQTGVTKLISLTDGKAIGDDAGATMPDGAAMMAIYGGKGDPEFLPASATKNPAGGWDLTLRMSRKDSQLRRIAKSEMMSLFTTGYTTAVKMDKESRATWQQFLTACDALPT